MPWPLLGAWVVLWLLTFIAFRMQRGALLIARAAACPPEVTARLLPSWFPVVWIAVGLKWAGVLAAGYFGSPYWAVGLVAADLIASATLPFPYGAFFPVYERRVSESLLDNPLLMIGLREALDNAKGQGVHQRWI